LELAEQQSTWLRRRRQCDGRSQQMIGWWTPLSLLAARPFPTMVVGVFHLVVSWMHIHNAEERMQYIIIIYHVYAANSLAHAVSTVLNSDEKMMVCSKWSNCKLLQRFNAHSIVMSGLSVFFRHYLTTTIDLNAASVSDPSSKARSESRGGDSTEQIVDAVLGDADETTVGDLYDQSLPMKSQHIGREKPKGTDLPKSSSFKEWRDEQCNLLQDYLVQRLFAPVAAEPNDDDPERTVEEEEEEAETAPFLETQMDPALETQMDDLPPSQDSAIVESQDIPRSDRKRQRVVTTAAAASNLDQGRQNSIIPNVSETYFTAFHISELDMYVQRCSIPVMEVTKVWHLRSTLERRRRMSHHSSECYQYDGPLATVYASVLSMEVHQARKEFVGEDEALRRHTEQIHTVSRLLDEVSTENTAATGSQQQHCEIFWYDSYAKAMDTILTDANLCVSASRSSTVSLVEVYLSLENIPAKCIFPYHSTSENEKWMRPTDWYDSNHTIPYCLCIGGKSAVECQTQISEEENSMTQRIRFDTNVEEQPSDLSIRCWVVVLPFVTSALLTAAAQQQSIEEDIDTVTTAHSSTANVMIPSSILEYKIGLGHPMQKRVFDCKSEDDAVLTEMKEIWGFIEKHHRKERVIVPVPVAPAVAAATSAAVHDATLPTENVNVLPRPWTTPQRDTGRGVSTPIARNPTAQNDITSPAESDPLLQQLMTPGERMKRRRMDVHLNFQYQKLVRACLCRKNAPFHRRSFIGNVRSCSMQSDLPDLLVNTEYSFYAAVLSYTQPYRTKRGDWIMSIALIDDSFQLCENGLSDSAFVHSITINIFVKPNERERLPMVRYAGDVIRLSNVKVQQWKDEYQLVSTRASTFVVLRRNGLNSNDPEMYPANDENVLMSDTEWEHMLDMWHWTQRRFMLHATMKISHRFRLSDMRMPDSTQVELYGDESTRGDLTVMVASILPIPSEQLSGVTPRGFLRVWDGTGVPKSDSLPIDTEQARESVRHGDPPSVCLIKISEIIAKLQDLRNNPDLQPPKALSGRVANVAIWEKQHWDLINEGIVSVGSFIRLRNVQDSLFKDKMFRCLHVHEKSSFTPLPNFTYEVLHMLEEHNNRLLRKEPINLDSGILPLFAGNIDQVFEPTNDQVSTTETSVARVDPLANITEMPIENRAISATTEGTVASLLPTTYLSLIDFMLGPVRSVFMGNVFVCRLYPDNRSLLEHGFDLICPLKANGTGRFYRFGLELQQACEDRNIDVVVSDDRCIGEPSIGEVLFGLSATTAITNSSEALSNFDVHFYKSIWKVQISSVMYNGKKYFILDSLGRT
jgi:Telomeric single stranded DNA binding POT1/CDC13